VEETTNIQPEADIKEERLPIEQRALVKVNPNLDPTIISFYNEAVKAREYAESRVIKTIEDLRPATDDLSLIAHIKKAMEEKRKEYVKPLQDHVKTVNDSFKALMDPVEQADRITRTKILNFQKEQERIRREQEEINRLREEAAQKQKELTGEITEVEMVEVVPEAPKRISTDVGIAGQRENWKWEVIDINLVPREYLMINAGILTPVVKASKGKLTIPGIRIYNEPIIQVSTR